MIYRILRTQYLITVFVAILVTGCDSSDPPENYGDDALQFEADFASYTEDERKFIYHATQLQPKMLKGIISPEDFRQIYNTHKKWLQEVARINTETPSMISTESRQINEQMERQLEKDRRYPRFDFRNLNLQWTNLVGQDLRNSIISGSGYKDIGPLGRPLADFRSANLIGIYAEKLMAVKTLLHSALLVGSDFPDADLSEAVLSYADLRWATFKRTRLTGARMYGAKVDGLVFEPLPRLLPDIDSIAGAKGLEGLTYERDPAALLELRHAFDKSGFHKQARKITHAIWLTERRRLSRGSLWERLESWVHLVFFEYTSQYSSAPYRPLIILFLLIPVFSLPYIFATIRGTKGGIWANRMDTAVNKKVLNRWVRIGYRVSRSPHVEYLRVIRICLCFSVICAFRIGFNQFDIGNWISRLQSRPYELRATGWVRSVAGWQSLVSLYLLSLSIICLIGRPFG